MGRSALAACWWSVHSECSFIRSAIQWEYLHLYPFIAPHSWTCICILILPKVDMAAWIDFYFTTLPWDTLENTGRNLCQYWKHRLWILSFWQYLSLSCITWVHNWSQVKKCTVQDCFFFVVVNFAHAVVIFVCTYLQYFLTNLVCSVSLYLNWYNHGPGSY